MARQRSVTLVDDLNRGNAADTGTPTRCARLCRAPWTTSTPLRAPLPGAVDHIDPAGCPPA